MTEPDARRPFDLINAQNRALNAAIARPDFDGDHLLDPTTNQAILRLHAANEAIVGFPQGAFPLDFARDAVESTNALLAKCRERYGVAIVKPMEQAFSRWFSLWFYAGPPQHPPEIFRKRLFRQEQALFDAICTANVGIAALSAAELPRRKAKKTERRCGGCRGKGPQTDFKRLQRKVFVKFLERKPVTPSVSAISRAHQCWNEHRKEWDAAAKNGTGYYDHKKLARAI